MNRAASFCLPMLAATLLLAGCGQTPQSSGPAGNADNYSIVGGSALNQPAPGVLGNDAQLPPGATVQLALPPTFGKVELQADGAFSYAPTWRFNGRDSFTYRIVDGDNLSPPVSVFITRPNVVLIVVDDLGYGDTSIYNQRDDIDTPNIDALAKNGVRFTHMHSSSPACAPTRYSLMTGNYPYRGRLAVGIYESYETATMILDGQATLGDVFDDAGYQTAFIGKLHNGGAFWDLAGDDYTRDRNRIDFSRPFDQGPTQFGFDYSFLLTGGTSDEPYGYFENDRLVRFNPSSGRYQPFDSAAAARANMVLNPHGWAGEHNGGKLGGPGWIVDNFDTRASASILTRKAQEFIQSTAITDAGAAPEPFFLYFAPPQLHRPYSPPEYFNPRHTRDDTPAGDGEAVAGTRANDRLDMIRLVDLMLGEVLTSLKDSGQLDNTLVVFTSDNGPFQWPQYKDMNMQGVDNGVPLRGYKGTIHEGGHRVPFIGSWGATLAGQLAVQPGSVSTTIAGLNDLPATFYALLGAQRPPQQANDSKSLLPALGGMTALPVRDHLIVQGTPRSAGGAFLLDRAYYEYDTNGDLWKLISVASSTDPLAGLRFTELYNLSKDPGERSNLLDSQVLRPFIGRLQAAYREQLAAARTVVSPE